MDFEFGDDYDDVDEYQSQNQDSQDSDKMDSDLEDRMLGYLHYNGVKVVGINSIKDDSLNEEADNIQNNKGTVLLEEGEIIESDASEEHNSDDDISMKGFTNSPIIDKTLTVVPNVLHPNNEEVKKIDMDLDILLENSGATTNRYFVESTKSQFRCYHCDQVGHSLKECPSKLKCAECGSTRLTTNDPNHYSCHECNFKFFNPTVKSTGSCTFCYSYAHQSSACRSFWRRYEKDSYSCDAPEKLFCYSCGGNDHYGDDCNPSSKEPRSAFNSSNIPHQPTNSRRSKSDTSANKHHALFTTYIEINPWLTSALGLAHPVNNSRTKPTNITLQSLRNSRKERERNNHKLNLDRSYHRPADSYSKNQNGYPTNYEYDTYSNSYDRYQPSSDVRYNNRGRSKSPASNRYRGYQRSQSPSDRYSRRHQRSKSPANRRSKNNNNNYRYR